MSDLLDEDGSVLLAEGERQRAETFSRVMGYLRPVRIGAHYQWNPGKVSEWHDRTPFHLPDLPEFRGAEQMMMVGLSDP